MKTKFIITLVTALSLLTSCYSKSDGSETINKKDRDKLPYPYIIEFTYKGHDYIDFSQCGKGVVHDPDCRKCLEAYD